MSTWLTALKAVPWVDLIAAAPAVTRGARKLFGRSTEETPSQEEAPRSVPIPTVVEALQNALERLQAQQQASAMAVQSLAEQNRQLHETVSVLQVRCQLLIWFSVVLTLILSGLVGWLVWQTWV